MFGWQDARKQDYEIQDTKYKIARKSWQLAVGKKARIQNTSPACWYKWKMKIKSSIKLGAGIIRNRIYESLKRS